MADSLNQPLQMAVHVLDNDSDFFSAAEYSESDYAELYSAEEEIIRNGTLNDANKEHTISSKTLNRIAIATLQCKEPGLVDTLFRTRVGRYYISL